MAFIAITIAILVHAQALPRNSARIASVYYPTTTSTPTTHQTRLFLQHIVRWNRHGLRLALEIDLAFFSSNAEEKAVVI